VAKSYYEVKVRVTRESDLVQVITVEAEGAEEAVEEAARQAMETPRDDDPRWRPMPTRHADVISPAKLV
jgi:hypothetical protein